MPDDALGLVRGNPAQQPRQASQFGELIPAVSAARQVSADGTSVASRDRTKDVDPELEPDLSAVREPVLVPSGPLTGHRVLQRLKERTDA